MGTFTELVGTAGWLNTLLSFKSQRKCCAPVRLCTSVQQDESPLVPPNSSCFCQQFQQNQCSWFHPGLDSRFHRNTCLIDVSIQTPSSSSFTIIIIFIFIFFTDYHSRRGGWGCSPTWWTWTCRRQGLCCGEKHKIFALFKTHFQEQNTIFEGTQNYRTNTACLE